MSDNAKEMQIIDDDAELEMEVEFNGEVLKGNDGVGIASIEQTTTSTEDGGSNEITITLTDGSQSKFQVLNGKKGSAGVDGKDGYTPVRGTDYWTEKDKAEIKSYVDEAILGGAW